MNRMIVAFCCCLVVLSNLGGCKLKPQLPKLFDSADVSNAYEDPSVWSEHTLGLPFTFGYDAGIARAQAEGKPAMIFLTTTWCKWCKKMSEDCLQHPEIRPILEDKFVLVLVDGDTETAAKRKLKNSGYPHIVFVSPDEKVLVEQKGYAKPEIFKSMVTLALQTTGQ